MEIVTGVWVTVGLMVLAVVLLMSVMASLYRKAGPHEALICYGFAARASSKVTAR
jgi:hypothetical protein